MSAGVPRTPLRFFRKLAPREISLFIILFVFACGLGVRYLGYLQFLEFKAYDFFIRQQTPAPSSDPIVLVLMTESDIQSPALDYPLYDDKLAELLRRIAADEPAVIALDIWRDLPVPRSGIHQDELNALFLSQSNLIAIFTLDGIAPPAVLKGNTERLAFNDNFPVDDGVDPTIPKVRRTMLYSKAADGEVYDSLPFRVATMYLERQGVVAEPDSEDPNAFRLGKAKFSGLRPNDGAYVRAHIDGWQILLDFKCPDNLPTYSVTETLAGKIPPGKLRGKIVLVGINAVSVSDDRVTPMGGLHRGIKVQAGAVHQLLREALNGEQPLQVWGDTLENLWVLVWCVAGGMIGYKVRSPWKFGGASLLCLVLIGALAWFAFRHGVWIPTVAPAVAFVPASAMVVSFVSYQEKKERGQIMQLFSKQVSPDIAQAIWEQRDAFLAGHRPRPQKLTATVLFSDLVGFTAISEKLDPAQLMDWLNEYMEAMATEVMDHQGVVEKYIGDAIMAVFGVPLVRTSEEEVARDARNAVECALAMAATLERLNGLWAQQGLPPAGMRIGIHTGSLVAGSLGSADRQEYTVIGDTVNTASRLESFSKEMPDVDIPERMRRCRILISDATFRLVEPHFETLRVGAMNLKNKAEPVMILRVLAAKAQTHSHT